MAARECQPPAPAYFAVEDAIANPAWFHIPPPTTGVRMTVGGMFGPDVTFDFDVAMAHRVVEALQFDRARVRHITVNEIPAA